MNTQSTTAGGATLLLALFFNLPYAVLTATFDYPGILRRPAGNVLDAFAAGGVPLVMTWYAFGLAALALVPVAAIIACDNGRAARFPTLAAGAAITGALAGLTQATGLFRWVFVVPMLATAHADPSASEATRIAAEKAFDVLNAYAGIGIGEHVGQLLTAMFIAATSMMQAREGGRFTPHIGAASAAAITIGTGEGLALAIGRDGSIFSAFTIGGFLGLTLWLIATGVAVVRRPAIVSARAGAVL